MLPISSAKVRFYVYTRLTDMRKSFDRLMGLGQNQMNLQPTGGDVFIFINRNRDRIKLLFWRGDEFWIYDKRLEQGSFQLPKQYSEGIDMEISYEQLMLILEVIDLESAKNVLFIIDKNLLNILKN